MLQLRAPQNWEVKTSLDQVDECWDDLIREITELANFENVGGIDFYRQAYFLVRLEFRVFKACCLSVEFKFSLLLIYVFYISPELWKARAE